MAKGSNKTSKTPAHTPAKAKSKGSSTTYSYYGPSNPYNVMPMTKNGNLKPQTKKAKKKAKAIKSKHDIAKAFQRSVKNMIASTNHARLDTTATTGKSKRKKGKKPKAVPAKSPKGRVVWQLPCESTIGSPLESMPWCHFTIDPLYGERDERKIGAETSVEAFPPELGNMLRDSRVLSWLDLEL